MAQALANDLWILIRREQESRAAMTQIVKPQCRWQLGPFQYRLKVLLDHVQSD